MILKTNAHITIKSYSKRNTKQNNFKKHNYNHNKKDDDDYYCFCEYINKDNDDVICYCTNQKTDWNKMNANIKKLQELGIIDF